MSSENLRMARINKQLQRELALIFESRIKKAGVKSIIITEVDCTKDLEKARVYFTALEHKKCPGILKDLNEIKGAVRSLLGQSIKLRRVPELEFVIDSSSEYGAKIDRILDSLGLIDHEAKHQQISETLLPNPLPLAGEGEQSKAGRKSPLTRGDLEGFQLGVDNDDEDEEL